MRRHFKPRRVRPIQQFTPVESAVLELRLILTVMRVRSHRRERSEHLPCGYSLLIYPGCHLRMLSGTGLERKSPHNQSTRLRRFDAAAYIVLRDGTHNSRTRMTQRNSYTTWAGLRRSNQDTQRNCAWKVTEVAVTRPLEVIRSRPRAYSTDATQCEVDLRSPTLPR